MPKIYSAGNSVPAADLNGIVQVAGGYAASVTGNDTYVITVTPVPGSYTAGDVFYFKADVANTGAATLNVNSLGAKTIKKWNSSSLVDLDNNDIQAGSLNHLIYDGTYFILLNRPSGIPQASASNTLQNSADTQQSARGNTYSKRKEVIALVGGIIRIKFDLKTDTGGFTVYGKIYINDVAIGTEQSTSSTSYTTYSEDIVVPAGAKVQLYTKTTNISNEYAFVQNFRFYYDKTIAGEAINVIN